MTQLPEKSSAWPAVEARMKEMSAHDVKWRDGKSAIYVFNAGPELEQVKKAAYAMLSEENGLGPAAFPSLAQMEREVVAFGLALMHAPPGAAGSMTSGGTESILMAVKAARDFARKNGLKGPANIIAPYSVHPAFDKAAMLMDIELRRVPVRDYLADVDAMSAKIDANTIMLVGSAPCFPFGLIDPIEKLGAVAAAKGVWLHVDACVGGYLAPFVKMNGADLPLWDFSISAVQSISGDLHKYGYASKGASTVFFRTEAQKDCMIFDVGPWPLGRMVTPTVSGTRPGGAIAAAWAVENFLGIEGYRANQAMVIEAREKIEAGVTRLGFHVLGKPQLGIISFVHERADTFALLGKLQKRGWITAALVDPKALHLMLSPVHREAADNYLDDLEAALKETDGARASTASTYAR